MTRQIGVRAMLLLTAVLAVWFAYYRNRAEIARLSPRVALMRSAAHELVISDESKAVVVKRDELWIGDNRWEAFLPAGEYRLNLATRKVSSDGRAPAAKSIAIPAGRHQFALEQRQEGEVFRIIVALDGRRVMEVEESKGWTLGSGWAESWSSRSNGENSIVLFCRRFMPPDARDRPARHDGPTNGILLWIERVR